MTADLEEGATVLVAGSAIFGDAAGIDRALARRRASVDGVAWRHEGRSGCRSA